jgi:sialic acid synthase SpsE
MNLFKHPLLLETACGHDGNEKTLKKLTDIAIDSGAKQIKFQIFSLDERSLPGTKERK